jgi:hypothetical protein
VSTTLSMNSTLRVDDHHLHHTTSEPTLQSSFALRWRKELGDINLKNRYQLLQCVKRRSVLPPLHITYELCRYANRLGQLLLGNVLIPANLSQLFSEPIPNSTHEFSP